VDFPIKSGDFPLQTVSSPEGNKGGLARIPLLDTFCRILPFGWWDDQPHIDHGTFERICREGNDGKRWEMICQTDRFFPKARAWAWASWWLK